MTTRRARNHKDYKLDAVIKVWRKIDELKNTYEYEELRKKAIIK